MKKIVSALLALALVGSVAVAEVKTAADVKISTSLFKVADTDNMDAADYFVANKLTDSKMTFSVDTGVAGATFQMKVGSQIIPGDLFGWVKLGDVAKLTLGSFTSRNANRVTGALDTIKYGYAESYDAAGVTEADKLASFVVDFYVGPFTLQLQPVTSKKDDFNIGGRVFGSFDGLANVTITANYDGAVASAVTKLGAYVDITAIENVGLVLGYSGKIEEDKNVSAAELRLQYKAGALTVTNHNNFSFGKEWFAFYNGVGLSYKANDKITAKITVDNYTGKNSAGATDLTSNKLIINPNFVYTVEKNATISSGVKITSVKDDKTSVEIPFALQVKF